MRMCMQNMRPCIRTWIHANLFTNFLHTNTHAANACMLTDTYVQVRTHTCTHSCVQDSLKPAVCKIEPQFAVLRVVFFPPYDVSTFIEPKLNPWSAPYLCAYTFVRASGKYGQNHSESMPSYRTGSHTHAYVSRAFWTIRQANSLC